MKLEARLATLEQRLAAIESGGAAIVVLEDGEELEQARERIKGTGGVIVVRRILTADEWIEIAPKQQRELIELLSR